MSEEFTVTMSFGNDLNQMIAEKVCGYLKVKFKESFTVLKIGDRLNTGHAKLYMKPENGKGIFTAYLYREDSTVSDDYVRMIVAEKMLGEILPEIKDIVSEVSAKGLLDCDDCSDENNPGIDLGVFNDKYSPKGLYITLVILSSENTYNESVEEKIIDVLKKKQNHFGFRIFGNIYVVNSETYSKINEKMEIYPVISETIMDEFDIQRKSLFNIFCEDGNTESKVVTKRLV